MRYRSLSISVLVSLWAAGAAPTVTATESELEGTAFVGRAATDEELAYKEDRREAAKAYAACLVEAKDTWFSKPDYDPCNALRDAYAQFLPDEIADPAVGCLEEGVLGAPRVAGRTCAAVRARFSIVISTYDDEEVAP